MKVLLLDAANTLIYKPSLWDKIIETLQSNGFRVDKESLFLRHKIISEIINFPDRTSKDFYSEFNAELLLALGIIPTKKILDDIFSACSYLPWAAFDDCQVLKELNIKKAVLSNFNSTLKSLTDQLIGKNIFDEFIISENENCRKPSKEFYQLAIERLDTHPTNILYIGDSLKLDIIPAQELGINTLLIDRENIFPQAKNRISSFNEIIQYI
ncbi:HAD family hydrolase [Chryseobacterium sp.]|uniref:HAD family hydrolase n=1 Tax=Chryseobacterium sp. TaxID=1871047 RepID=UPI00260BB912|nr:HAD family hydrolase [Chryseobacterium sp.]